MRQFINERDIVLLHSNIMPILSKCEDSENLNVAANGFLDAIIEILTDEGTLLLPTFNWGFCHGKTFDWRKTKSKVGSLTNIALGRSDFKRTKHPIYSFAVWGRYKDYLCDLDNKNSFGADGPFGFIHEQDAKIILLNVDYQKSFTFAHYIEEQLSVDYRLHKDFTAFYVGADGNKTEKTYNIFVRDLDHGVITHVNPMGEILEDEDVVKTYSIDGNRFIVMRAREAFDRIAQELRRVPHIMVKWDKYEKFKTGQRIHDLARRLFYLPRSLTGDGNRKTLQVLKEFIPELNIREVPASTEVFDWKVPPEWNVEDAYIITPDGNKICDFKENNLHLVGYSDPVEREMSYNELVKYLRYNEKQPQAIPYETMYYNEGWGFCLSYNQFNILPKEGTYKVVVKSMFKDGGLTFGDVVLPGKVKDEVLLSCYICHPSMTNDSLSGVVLTAFLANYVRNLKNRHFTYRFVFVPETIGSIAYLSQYGQHLRQYTKYGLVLTCVGNEGKFHYKQSRRGDAEIDNIVENILLDKSASSGCDYEIERFWPSGSDERQYCSPGFNLPVGSLMKSVYGRFEEYHNSLDNLEFVTPKALEESFIAYTYIINVIEHSYYWINTKPCCEPFRTKYLRLQGADRNTINKWEWLLNFSDGIHSLVDISNKSGFPIPELIPEIQKLEEIGLLKRKDGNGA